MRAAVLTDTHGFEVAEVPDPSPGAGELVLRVGACGICGSDIKARHHMPGGLVMGHEFAGEIVACGADTGSWREGQQVSALPIIGCGVCPPCVNGEPAHCVQADLVGVGGSSGGYAEYVKVSARETFALPEGFDSTMGALTEPLAVGLHALARAKIAPGARVLVVGGGPVGLAVTVWARQFGASELVVSDPSSERREAAGTFGATRVVDPTAEEVGTGYDVVFECVGIPGMVDVAVGAAGLHGRVVIVGVCVQPDPFVPIRGILTEITMDFVIYYTRREFAYVIDAFGHGVIDPRPFVTDRIGLEGVDGAFKELDGSRSQVKILVLPGT
ncbi:MAG: alcohol dehydrogenase catalytic domain-containing protein [Acidimicrobiia bacterium]